MKKLPPILDACCGGRMMWADKADRDILAQDIRSEVVLMTDRGETRTLAVHPDIIGDFRKMQFQDDAFPLIMFDPPHLVNAGVNSWLRKKYGKLDKQNWQQDLAAAFKECGRVLAHKGTLVFKWNTCQLAKKTLRHASACAPSSSTAWGKPTSISSTRNDNRRNHRLRPLRRRGNLTCRRALAAPQAQEQTKRKTRLEAEPVLHM